MPRTQVACSWAANAPLAPLANVAFLEWGRRQLLARSGPPVPRSGCEMRIRWAPRNPHKGHSTSPDRQLAD